MSLLARIMHKTAQSEKTYHSYNESNILGTAFPQTNRFDVGVWPYIEDADSIVSFADDTAGSIHRLESH